MYKYFYYSYKLSFFSVEGGYISLFVSKLKCCLGGFPQACLIAYRQKLKTNAFGFRYGC